MKKSSSAPCLTSLSASPSIQKQKITTACTLSPTVSRRSSVCSSYAMADMIHQPLSDFWAEAQLEAITHSPGYTVGMCMLENKVFPSDILSHERNNEVLQSFGACIASPPEHVELAEPIIYKPHRNDARIIEMLVRIRRERAKRKEQ